MIANTARCLCPTALNVTGTLGSVTHQPEPASLVGTPKSDAICGPGGIDTMRGPGGNDVPDGGPGNDALDGSSGGDVLLGTADEANSVKVVSDRKFATTTDIFRVGIGRARRCPTS